MTNVSGAYFAADPLVNSKSADRTELKQNWRPEFMLFTKANILFVSDSLQDEHVLDLSKRITNGEELMDFGIKCLGLPDFKIKTAMYDHSDSIQAATYELLSTWMKKQTDRQEAYKNLQCRTKEGQDEPTCQLIWEHGLRVLELSYKQ